jgi:hypothetical protein
LTVAGVGADVCGSALAGWAEVIGAVVVGAVVVGVPDRVGASAGVAGALSGIFDAAVDSADMEVHSDQSTVQSQMSPSA